MKHTFKKVVVLALAVIMCVSAVMPSAMAATTTCPGQGATHTAYNCTYTTGTVSAATCEAAGSELGVCTVCNDKFILATVEATGHDWEYSAADCDTASYRTCKTCKKVELVKAAAGHAWGDWEVQGDGCRVGEKRVQVCTVCGAKNEDIMTDEHSWVLDEFVAPTRCGTAGYSVYVCANKGCGAERSEEVWLGEGAAAHSYITWRSVWLTKNDPGYTGNFDHLEVYGDDPTYVAKSCTTKEEYTEICQVCGVTRFIIGSKNTTHTSADIGKKLQFVAPVLEDCCTTLEGTHAYWKCYDCGALYQAKDPVAENVTELDSTGVERVKTKKYTYNMTEIGAAVTDNKVANVTKIKALDAHYWAGVSKSATCTEPGYVNRYCTMCGKVENTTSAALGHLFAPNVTSGQKDIAKRIATANGVTWTSNTGFDWNQVMANVHKNTYFRTEGTAATCTTDGKYEWRCLRDGCYGAVDGNGKSIEGRMEVIVPATGHNFSTTVKAASSQPATCSLPGVDRYVCNNANCNVTNNVVVAALGHDMKSTTVAATCAAEGSVTEYCSRKAACGLEDKVTVLPKDPNNHAWTELQGTTPVAATCTTPGKGIHQCDNCQIAPVAYETAALGHKYTSGKDLTDAIKALTTVGSTVNGVTYLQAGDCAQVAKYKLACLNANCAMFTYHEVSEGFNVGGHDVEIVYRNNSGDAATGFDALLGVNGTYNYSTVVSNKFDNVFGQYKSDNFSGLHNSDTYGQKAPSGHMTSLSTAVSGKNYYWYCKNEGCPKSRTETDPMHIETIDANANGHFIRKEDGTYRLVALTDVPDANISKVTYDKAKLVKAPTDENGKITAVAVEIPGTTLVWRYVVDPSCEYDEVKEGGFWCVECQAAYDETNCGCDVENAAKRGHTLDNGMRVNADCQNYGYVRYSCTGCDYAIVKGYTAPVAHAYTILEDVKATCLLDGYQFLKCRTCAETTVIVPNAAEYKATGHKNINNQTLTTSCLSDATITNRFCVSCATVIVADHAYDAKNTCIYCGRTKQN